MKISLITPTYNEAKNIKKLITDIDKVIKRDYEIIVIDDNSPDNTWKIVDNLSGEYNIRLIRRARKLGLSSAVVAGFKKANSPIMCVMDADLSHPVNKIPIMLKHLFKNNLDIVIGSRLIRGGGVENWPFHRKLISRIAITLSKPLPRIKVKDTMSGFFMLRKKVIKGINFNSTGYKILLEILLKGNYSNIMEIPYLFQNRVVGASKLDVMEYINFLSDILKLYSYKLKKYLRL